MSCPCPSSVTPPISLPSLASTAVTSEVPPPSIVSPQVPFPVEGGPPHPLTDVVTPQPFIWASLCVPVSCAVSAQALALLLLESTTGGSAQDKRGSTSVEPQVEGVEDGGALQPEDVEGWLAVPPRPRPRLPLPRPPGGNCILYFNEFLTITGYLRNLPYNHELQPSQGGMDG